MMKQSIIKFNAYWLDKNKENPVNYPIEMSEGDWHEQYLAWLSLEDWE